MDFENSLRSDTQNPYDFKPSLRQEIFQNSLNQAVFSLGARSAKCNAATAEYGRTIERFLSAGIPME